MPCGMHSIRYPICIKLSLGLRSTKRTWIIFIKYDVQHKSMYKDKYYSKYAYLESNGPRGSRRYGGSNFAELELSNRNQDSGTSPR